MFSALPVSDLVTIGTAGGFAVLGWATWVTKMVWDIRTTTKVASARHEQRLDDHEGRIDELEAMFPRTVPTPIEVEGIYEPRPGNIRSN